MRIVILGAGEIGAAAARQLAATSLVSRVVLVDPAATVAAGKALDIAQAAPVDRFDTAVMGTDDETALIGASAVVVADRHGAPATEWTGEAGLALLGRVSDHCEDAPILCAGATQATIVERGVRELGLDRRRLFGTATEAVRAAIVSLVALEAEASPAEVSLLAIGRPPRAIIVPWERASIGGRAAVDVLPPPVLMRLEQRISRLWPPGPLTLGAAATRVLRSMIQRTPAIHALQVAITRDEGYADAPAMLPARVGPHGIRRLEPLPLSTRDRVRLDSVLAR